MFNGTTIRFGWDSPLTVVEEEEVTAMETLREDTATAMVRTST